MCYLILSNAEQSISITDIAKKIREDRLKERGKHERRETLLEEFQYPYLLTPFTDCINSKNQECMSHSAGMCNIRNPHKTFDGLNKPVSKILI